MAGRKKEKEKKKKKDAAVSAKRQMKEKKKKQGKGKGGLLSRISKPAYMEKIERTQDLVHMLFDGYSERYGIFWKDGRYSKMYEMEDVSFAKAQDEDKYIIMKKWMDLFHSLSKNVHVQILVTSVPTKQEEYKKNFLYHREESKRRNAIATELNGLIEKTMGERTDSALEQKRYIIVSIEASSMDRAVDLFQTMTLRIENKLTEIGSSLTEVSCQERLEYVYNFYHGRKFSDDTRDGDGHPLMAKGTEGLHRITPSEYADASSMSIYDLLAPKSANFSKKDYFTLTDDGGKTESYMRVLYIPADEARDGYPATMSPQFMNDLQNMSGMDFTISMGISPIPGDETTKLINRQITSMKEEQYERQKRDAREGLYGISTNDKLEDSLENARRLRQDVQSNSQRLFRTCFFFMIKGKTLDSLETNSLKLIEQAAEQGFTIDYYNFEQPEGICMVMPFADSRTNISRTLTSDNIACSAPFNAKDLMHPQSIYYGMNLISKNAIFADRKKLMNGNGCVLATSGAGKSFFVKMNIEQILLRYPEDNVIVIDPNDEYGPLIRFFGGEEIEISNGAKTHINPFDLDKDYDDNGSPIKAKIEYILAFIDSIVSSGAISELSSVGKSIIDRCCRIAFERYEATGFSDEKALPSLPSFYQILKSQPEAEAKVMAGALERYVFGSNDLFAKRTNVQIHKRFVSFNIKRLPESLKTTGYLVVLDHIWNTLAKNKERQRNTWIFIDEFHVLLQNEFASRYIARIYKEGRKMGAYPTIITQNISDVLESSQGNKILGNSEFAVILKQKSDDLKNIAEIFNISEGEKEYVTDCPKGQGIIVYAKDKVVFRNIVSKNSIIYKLNNTDSMFQSRN